MEFFNSAAQAIGTLLTKRSISLILLVGLFGGLKAQPPTASLEAGTTCYEKVLFVEAEGGGDWEGNHLTISFTGDFRVQALDVDLFTLDWEDSWFATDPIDLALQWEVNCDSTIAVLDVWKADLSNSIGRGHFFTIAHPGGTGILILDGILKRSWTQDPHAYAPEALLTAYPVPCHNELKWVHNHADAQTVFQIQDVSGKVLASTQDFGMDISHLPPGIYVLTAHSGNMAGGRNASVRFIKD